MKVKIVKDKTIDISHLLTKCVWSGSRLQVARRLQFDFVQDDRDPNIPVIDIDNGYTVQGCDDKGNIVFVGNIYRLERNRKEGRVSVTALDHLHVLGVSKTTRKFNNIPPEAITKQICQEMGVLPGKIAETGTNVSFIANGKTGYQIIQAAYFEASKTTKKKYHPIMDGAKLNVIEKGELIKDEETKENYTADSSTNMTDSVYRESIEKLINQVLVVDDKGNTVSTQRDEDSIKKYSMFQSIYKTDPKKDTQTEVKDLMEKNKPDRGGYITVLGDYRVKSSYSIIVKDSLFKGQFWVKADTHTFIDGKHEMKLELEFENTMNEEKADKEKS
jgi:hypothetical protein